MPRTFPLTLVLALLAGCGSNGTVGNSTAAFDKGFRDSFRPKFVASCQAGAQKSSNTTKDFTEICSCIADKLIATKSASELMVGPTDEETGRLTTQCMQEHPLQ
jgi:hypothetical protein